MGLATTQTFAEAGAAFVLADFKEDAVKAAEQKFVAAGHKALAVRCDVSDAQLAAMVDRTVAEFGRLDTAFNNAGVMARIAPIADTTREDWDRVIGINLRSAWSCMKQELRKIKHQRSGAIIQQRLGRRVDRQPRHRFLHRRQAGGGRPNRHADRRDVVHGDQQACAEMAKATLRNLQNFSYEVSHLGSWQGQSKSTRYSLSLCRYISDPSNKCYETLTYNHFLRIIHFHRFCSSR
jgi:NAD(P)-dependent dehydrogenase (short-subunit alcohol dehydrogenase family)